MTDEHFHKVLLLVVSSFSGDARSLVNAIQQNSHREKGLTVAKRLVTCGRLCMYVKFFTFFFSCDLRRAATWRPFTQLYEL